MRIIPLRGRMTGKTTTLVRLSAKTGQHIVCGDAARARNIKRTAESLGVSIPEPITPAGAQWLRSSPNARDNGVLVDDLDYVLSAFLGTYVTDVTWNGES